MVVTVKTLIINNIHPISMDVAEAVAMAVVLAAQAAVATLTMTGKLYVAVAMAAAMLVKLDKKIVTVKTLLLR
jgi:hypothetical protein